MISDILSALIGRATKIEEEMADLEEILSQRRADLAQIMQEDIPSVLHENGLLSAPLADGRTVSIDQIVNVVQVDRLALGKWLAMHDYDAIIKTELDFGKGTDISDVETFLLTHGIDYHKDTSIHPMSLKKVMRDHLESGGILPPEDVARVTVFERAKIKGGKE